MANEITPLNEQEAEQAGEDKTETEVIKVHDRARGGGYKDNVFGSTSPRGKPSPHTAPFRLNGGGGGGNGGGNGGGDAGGGENNGGGGE